MPPRRFSVFAEYQNLDWADDPEEVEERAQLLLGQLDMLADVPVSRSRAIYKRSTVEWEAWALLNQCTEHGIVPPRSLSQLFGRLLDATAYTNDGPRDKAAWYRAVMFEAQHPASEAERRTSSSDRQPPPSNASETAIARHVWPDDVPGDHRELRAWRRDDRYRRKVKFFRRLNEREG